jgi:DNA-directed RNA polymerase subunit F
MEESYLNYIKKFNNLDIDDKKEEIKNNLYDLLKLLYFTNKKIDNMNDILPIYSNYSNEDEYFNLLFSYIISLKEENAKLLEKLENT